MRHEYERWIRGRVACAGLMVVAACSDRPMPGDDDSETLDGRDEPETSTGEVEPDDPTSTSGIPDLGTSWNHEEPIGHNPGGGNALAHLDDYGLEIFLSNSTAITCDDPYAAEVCEDEPVWSFSIWIMASDDYRRRWDKDEGWIATWHRPTRDDGTCTWTGGHAIDDPFLVIESVDDDLVVASIEGMIPIPSEGTSYSGEIAAHVCD